MSEEEKDAIWYCSEILADNENDIERWKIVENYINKMQKENEELNQSNFHFLEINQKLIEEKPIIKELTKKELNLLEKIDKLQEENEELQKELNSKIEALDRAMNCVDYISKNTIRDKIKGLKVKREKSGSSVYGYGIYFLEQLLEEN